MQGLSDCWASLRDVDNRRQAAKEAAELALKGLSNNPNIQLFRGDGVQVDVADLDPEVLKELNKDLRTQVAGCFDEIDESGNRLPLLFCLCYNSRYEQYHNHRHSRTTNFRFSG